jgi:hypothetical protein
VSARVYVFADFGHGPRVRASWKPGAVRPEVPTAGEMEVFAARAWWVVECENAEAGRRIIEEAGDSRAQVTVRMGPHLVTGRILDHGGAGMP